MLSKFNPAIPRHYLLAIAGTLWTFAGVLLCVRALLWLGGFEVVEVLAVETAGVAAAIAVYEIGLSKIVDKNIDRIGQLPDRACLFAFTAWRGYAMIALMIGAGVALRRVPFPKYLLSGPYTAMGGALLGGSAGFYRAFLNVLRTGEH
jgi:hypothetical protein